MSSRTSMRLAAAGALAITLAVLPAFASAARDGAVITTELSAQNDQNKNKNKNQQQNKNQGQNKNQQQNKNQGQNKNQQNKQFQGNKGGQKNAPKLGGQNQKQGGQGQFKQGGSQKLGGSQKNVKIKTFTPKSANAKVVTAIKIKGLRGSGANRFAIRGHNYSAWRSGYRVRHGNGWRTFAALSALGVLAIGATQYYPYAYIDSPADYCEGLTEDGCQLNFDEVETVEGDVVGQCVAYCPWQ